MVWRMQIFRYNIAGLQETLTDYPDKIAVGILDVDQNSDLVNDLKIMSVPTIIVFQNSQEQKRIFGQVSKDELLKEIVGLI